MDPFAPIRPGGLSPFVNKFSTVQKSMQILRDLDRNGATEEGAAVVKPLPSSLKILVENQTGEDLNPGDIVAVGEAALPFAGDDQYTFRDTPTYVGTIPDATDNLFAILEEPAAAEDDDGNYSYANAVILGHAVCDVDITDEAHEFATPTASDQTKLTSATSGPARIIDRESTGTGTKRCGVKIDEQTASSASATVWVSSANYANGSSTSTGSGDISAYPISADDTWEDTSVNITVPETGIYLIFVPVLGFAQFSGGTNSAIIYARLYNVTQASPVGVMANSNPPQVTVTRATTVNVAMSGSATYVLIYSLTAGDVIRLEALRLGGPTWTTANVSGYSGGWATRIHLLKLE